MGRGEWRQALEHVGREGAGGRGNGTFYLTVAMGQDHGERGQAFEHAGQGEGRGSEGRWNCTASK